MSVKHKCDNCGGEWNDREIIDLEDVPDLNQRLDAGSEVPSGECPGCGSLVYIENEQPGDRPLNPVWG